MRALAQDARFVLRQLRRTPAFTISAVLTLALGIGANTGLFSLVNGYWRPLPVPGGDRIVLVAASLPGDDDGQWFRFSFPELTDYREQTRDVFSDVFAFETLIGGLTVAGKTTQFTYHPVSGNLFSGLQVTPFLGRLFVAGEGERPGEENLIVLSHSYWQKRFAGDASAIGTSVRMNGVPARIVGVAPPELHGLYQGVDMEGYVTLGAVPRTRTDSFFTDRAARSMTMLARLKPGVGLAEAQSAVDVVARRLQAAHPVIEKNVTARVMWETDARPTPLRSLSSLAPLVRASALGLASLVLLIACMNVANLLFVRATARQRELAVRAALGSGRYRLIQLLLLESAVLGVAGTVAGLVLARWSTDLFLASVTPAFELPLNLDFDYDWRVFVYAAAISAGTGLLVGVLPALRASRPGVTGVLHDGGYGASSGGSRLRVRNLLVIAQVAGSLVLLVVAGLFVRSLQRAQFADLSFEPRGVLTARLNPRQVGYTVARATQFYDELEDRLERLPGVESVSMAITLPLGYVFESTPVIRDGDAPSSDEPQKLIGCNTVTPRYFDTMRLPIVSGRAFADTDTEDSRPVVIVNETMARQYWPGQDPIGKRIRAPRTGGDTPFEVVGVARDSKYVAVFEGPAPHLYFAMAQVPTAWRTLQIRTSGAPEALAPLVERAVQSLDPDLPVADLRPMTQALEGGAGVLMFRIGATQAGAMGLLGLLLAIVGVYGVVSYGASQRTREMGIRIALGAEPWRVRSLVMRQGVALVAAGVVVGIAAAALVTRLIGRFFVLVGAGDPTTFLAVTALLYAIAMAACYLPARRAMRVDPMTALRHE